MTAALSFERVCALQIRAGNTEWVEELRDGALEKIGAGKGVVRGITKGQLNGKIVEATLLLTSLQVAEIAQSALDYADGILDEGTGITFLDFSRC